jgi:hypothetical protein
MNPLYPRDQVSTREQPLPALLAGPEIKSVRANNCFPPIWPAEMNLERVAKEGRLQRVEAALVRMK